MVWHLASQLFLVVCQPRTWHDIDELVSNGNLTIRWLSRTVPTPRQIYAGTQIIGRQLGQLEIWESSSCGHLTSTLVPSSPLMDFPVAQTPHLTLVRTSSPRRHCPSVVIL